MRLRNTLFIFIFASFFYTTHAVSSPLPKDIVQDAKGILEMHNSISSLQSTGSTFQRFSGEYLLRIGRFTEKYGYMSHIFSLQPTLDRSMQYVLRIQQFPLSCEIDATRIVLQGMGIKRSEQDIIRRIPQYPGPYATGGIWGDPDVEFVGSYTGTQGGRTGYGVHEAPIAEYLKTFGLQTRIINRTEYDTLSLTPHLHLQELLKQLENPKSHVILWGDWCTDPQYEDGLIAKGGRAITPFFPIGAKNTCDRTALQRVFSWQTPSGKNIIGISGEHAYVLLGYVGNIESPTHIIVWDTYTGRHVFPYVEWMRKWNLLDNRSLIITKQ